MEFRIEGWFPPSIIVSPINGRKYAICGSNWVEISHSMTMEEVTKGWICTAKDVVKPLKEVVYKRPSKVDIFNVYKKLNEHNNNTKNNKGTKDLRTKSNTFQKHPTLF